MRAVNLMPRDERRVRFEAGWLPLVAAIGGIAVVSAGAFFVGSSASAEAAARESEIQAVEAEIALLPAPPDSAVSVGTLSRERLDRVTALASALRSATAFDRLLRNIAYVFPEDAWLTQLDASAPDTAVLPEGVVPPPQSVVSGVTIQGASFSHRSVADVLARLALVPALTDVRLTSTSLVEPQPDDRSSSSGRSTTAGPREPFVTFVVSASVRTGDSP